MSAPIIGLIGAARAGKDSVAEALCTYEGYRRLAFADKLKEVALSVSFPFFDPVLGVTTLNDIVRTEGWEKAKSYPEVRRFLQELGMGVRTHLGENAWVEPVVAAARGAASVGRPVVITDVRFPNEVDAIREAGGVFCKITRPGLGRINGHVSEALAWDATRSWEHEVVNDGTLADLRKRGRAMARVAGKAHVRPAVPSSEDERQAVRV